MVGVGLTKRGGTVTALRRSAVGAISVQNSQPGTSGVGGGPRQGHSEDYAHPESDEDLPDLPFVMPPEPNARRPKKRIHADKKLALLEVILEKKDVLFGQLTPTLEYKDKQKAWEEVREKALSLEIISPSRNWTDVRDKIWGVWKSRSLEKLDNSRKTGAAGGAKYQPTDVDLKIYQIIGDDSPVMDGLPIPESLRPAPRRQAMSQVDVGLTQDNLEMPEAPPRKKRRVIYAETADLKRQKQLQLLDTEIYFKKLQCLKLERELKVQPSKFTMDIPVYEELIVDIEPID